VAKQLCSCRYLLHLNVLHMDSAEPAQPHHLRNPARIVPVGFLLRIVDRDTRM